MPLAPPVSASPSITERILGNPLGLILIVLIGFGAVALFIWTLLNMVLPSSDNLNRRLKVYEDPYGGTDEEADDPADGSHTTVPIIQRAVEFTASAALCMVHLSRMAEELVIWASQEFGLPDTPTIFVPMFFSATIAAFSSIVSPLLESAMTMSPGTTWPALP